MPALNFSVTDVICWRNNRPLFASVNFTLHQGEAIHIQGPNGIGKSTLLRCLIGLARPQQGSIDWCNVSVYDNETFKQQLHFIGHKNAIKSSLTIIENLQLSPTNSGCASTMHAALEHFGLLSKQQTMAQDLSAGQKQRLAWAKLMSSTALLWILDEPLAALDKESIDLVDQVMHQHLENGGIIIYTSHQQLPLLQQASQRLQIAAAEDLE